MKIFLIEITRRGCGEVIEIISFERLNSVVFDIRNVVAYLCFFSSTGRAIASYAIGCKFDSYKELHYADVAQLAAQLICTQ